MLSVITWECACGTHVKAMYETVGMTTVKCPNSKCDATHIVTGKVTNLWVEDPNHVWSAHDVTPLVSHKA